jgi:hypothetical protein
MSLHPQSENKTRVSNHVATVTFFKCIFRRRTICIYRLSLNAATNYMYMLSLKASEAAMTCTILFTIRRLIPEAGCMPRKIVGHKISQTGKTM